MKIECESQRSVVILPECQNTRNRDTKRRGDEDQECEVREEEGIETPVVGVLSMPEQMNTFK